MNYDPQTYASYPGSPQGIPDLNIIPQLPSVSGYASIVNGNYENVTHTHEQDDLDLGQLSSGTLDQLNLREVVSVPEYFLVPLATVPDSIASITQVKENFGTDPVLPRGYGADYNDTAYPFYPGDRPGLSVGHSESWYFGEPLGPTAATVLLSRPATAGTVGPLRNAHCRWFDPMGSLDRQSRPERTRSAWRSPPVRGSVCPSRCSAERSHLIGSWSPPRAHRTSWAGPSLPHCGQERGGWPASRRGTWSSRRCNPPSPSQRVTTAGHRDSGAGALEQHQVRRDPGAGTDGIGRDPFRRLGCGLEGDGVGQRRSGPQCHRRRRTTWFKRSGSQRATMW